LLCPSGREIAMKNGIAPHCAKPVTEARP